MPVSMLTEAIEQGVPLVVFVPASPRRCALLRCAAYLTPAASLTSVTVVTLFSGGQLAAVHAVGAAILGPGRAAER